jgi:hypothetical protein
MEQCSNGCVYWTETWRKQSQPVLTLNNLTQSCFLYLLRSEYFFFELFLE